jgi:cytosine/adenosine deaminase-related metal-dependent hydrolase
MHLKRSRRQEEKSVRCSKGVGLNSWILTGARVACGPQKSDRLDLQICSGKILAIDPSIKVQRNVRRLDLDGCLILPGLINAHDHLEFNLFPRLGNGPYPSASAWAQDIYQPYQSPVKEHLSIPMGTRLRWGAVKNLLSGVTTVCHHNNYHRHIFSGNFPISVPHHYGWAHSLEFSPDLEVRFRQTSRNWPFILHVGESVNSDGKREMHQLDALGALDDRTVLVHAVALGARDLQVARARGASIVWCPSSNIYLLGRTLSEAAHKSGIPIALGTDSALSCKGDLLDEIRFARQVGGIPPSRLYNMVTLESAQIMRLKEGQGNLIPGGTADLLVVKDSSQSPASALVKLRTGAMEMVFLRGEVKLASPDRVKQLPPELRPSMHLIEIAGRKKSRAFIAVDLPSLFRNIEPIIGSVVLAHKKMKNP